MRFRALGTLRRGAQSVRNRFVRGAIILLYHRIAELPTDPQLLCVSPRHFAEHLEILRKKYSPIGLRELSQGYQQGSLPERAVVVTLDDGYFDNLANAKPLLERYDIAATVFVTTGYIGRQREFWSDQLERLLLQPGTLPQTLSLTINGKPYYWTLGNAAFYNNEAYERHHTWNVLNTNIAGPRQLLYGALHRIILPLPDEDQRKVLDGLLAWAGMEPMVRSTHRTLSANEVVCLGEGGLVEVGAHTLTHPILSALPAAVQQAEILGSKTQLEEILGRRVTSFAYPYGYRSDYAAQTVSLVREAGFARACSAFPDMVWRGSDVFQLPRVAVFDCAGEEFSKRIERWYQGDLTLGVKTGATARPEAGH
jgi:peptidoglycan/xylan/chitin deacetylase (PgdA/CDA1 family)